jgi:hypothetical protein
MSPSFTTKRGVRYPSYVSSALLRGTNLQAGSVTRLASQELEAKVLDVVRGRFGVLNAGLTQRELLEQFVERITIKAEGLTFVFKNQSASMNVVWNAKRAPATRIESDPGEAKSNKQLICAVVRSHIWLKWLRDGTYQSIEEIAKVIKLHPKVVRHRIRLAFLAPQIVRSILDGSYGAATTATALCNSAELSWTQQRRDINLTQQTKSHGR